MEPQTCSCLGLRSLHVSSLTRACLRQQCPNLKHQQSAPHQSQAEKPTLGVAISFVIEQAAHVTLNIGVRSPENNTLESVSHGYTHMWLLRMKQWYSCQARKQKPVANDLISGTIVDTIQIGSMTPLEEGRTGRCHQFTKVNYLSIPKGTC